MRLLAITAELHVFEGVTNWDQPLRLGIAIEGREFIRVRERRGDSIGIDHCPLQPADLDEGGRVEVHDLTERLDPALRGSDIEGLRSIEEAEGLTIGLALMRRNASPFCLWVDDDEFRWGDDAALEAATLTTGMRARIGPLWRARRAG